ncbi:MAG: hypothetical protein CVU64_23665 [Deltaproteobacteria bacterium HGW-Deltaproteobacteria-21]|nr:MAG: hypothetical protein CVU64_23665 [Deltaproteobacteria bacterium HGW-Deltaproteobacteria-21]
MKDSKEVASALEKLGMMVKLVLDPSSRELKALLQEMAFSTGGEKNRGVIFYFAGHGETLNLADGTRLGYIIPSDCPLKSADPMKFDDLAISMKDMEAVSLKAQSKHMLMVFDSCFSGSLFNLVRAAPVEIFYVKYKNDNGDFPNQLLDNGDGTITDQATGLMWEKDGSASSLRHNEVAGYVTKLRSSKSRGHEDWRVPTLEELCSLLEPVSNAKGRFMSSLFSEKTTECWTADVEGDDTMYGQKLHIVDFSKGTLSTESTVSHGVFAGGRCYVKAVRTIK